MGCEWQWFYHWSSIEAIAQKRSTSNWRVSPRNWTLYCDSRQFAVKNYCLLFNLSCVCDKARIETEQIPLKYQLSQPKLTAMQMRLINELSELKLKFVYKSDREYSLVDTLFDLSVNDFTISNVQNADLEVIKSGYKHDSHFTTLRSNLGTTSRQDPD